MAQCRMAVLERQVEVPTSRAVIQDTEPLGSKLLLLEHQICLFRLVFFAIYGFYIYSISH
jgi:hypothetical protein